MRSSGASQVCDRCSINTTHNSHDSTQIIVSVPTCNRTIATHALSVSILTLTLTLVFRGPMVDACHARDTSIAQLGHCLSHVREGQLEWGLCGWQIVCGIWQGSTRFLVDRAYSLKGDLHRQAQCAFAACSPRLAGQHAYSWRACLGWGSAGEPVSQVMEALVLATESSHRS